MTKVLLPSGQPIAEARQQLRRHAVNGPVPTGEAATATSKAWTTTAVGSGTANTKGTWVEVVSATTVDIYGLLVSVTQTNTAAANSSALLDIGVGAAASEVVVVPNLAVGWRSSNTTGFATCPVYRLPLFIPSGSRIAVRCQGAETSKSVGAVIIPLNRTSGPRRPSTSIVDLNANTATSFGTSLGTPGATNTETAWTQLVAATAEPFSALTVGIQGGADTTQGTADCLVDIGMGASGSEVVIVPNVYVQTNTSEIVTYPDTGPWSVYIPPGSRLAARVQQSATASTLDVIVYGIR